MRRIVTTVCVLIGSWAATAEAASPPLPDKIDLRFIVRPGFVTRQRIVSRTVGSIRLFDPLPEQKFSQTFEQDLTMKCRKVSEDKSSVVDVRMDRIAMKMSIAGMNIEFDSNAPASGATSSDREAADMLGTVFSAMVGSTFTMTVGPDGQPLKVEGVKEMMKKVGDRLSEEEMPAAIRKMYDQMANIFGDDNVMQDMQSCNRMIPSKGPVRVGDKWDRKWEMTMPLFQGRIEGEGRYELLSIEEFRGRLCAKIGVKESFRMSGAPVEEKASPTATSAPAKGILERLSFDLKASGGDGVAYWDFRDGCLVQLRQTQRMTMEIGFAPDANAEEEEMKKGMPKMVQKLNTSVSVDLLDDAETAGREKAASATAPESSAATK